MVCAAFESQYFVIAKSVVVKYSGLVSCAPLSQIYQWMDAFMYSFGPFVIMLVAYFCIIHKFIFTKSTDTAGQTLNKSATRGTVMLLTILTSFVLLTAPLAVVWVSGSSPNPVLVSVMATAMYLNHSVNCLLYTFVGKRFRQQLMEVLRGKRRVHSLEEAVKGTIRTGDALARAGADQSQAVKGGETQIQTVESQMQKGDTQTTLGEIQSTTVETQTTKGETRLHQGKPRLKQGKPRLQLMKPKNTQGKAHYNRESPDYHSGNQDYKKGNSNRPCSVLVTQKKIFDNVQYTDNTFSCLNSDWLNDSRSVRVQNHKLTTQ